MKAKLIISSEKRRRGKTIIARKSDKRSELKNKNGFK